MRICIVYLWDILLLKQFLGVYFQNSCRLDIIYTNKKNTLSTVSVYLNMRVIHLSIDRYESLNM